jgi:hypothetical protein
MRGDLGILSSTLHTLKKSFIHRYRAHMGILWIHSLQRPTNCGLPAWNRKGAMLQKLALKFRNIMEGYIRLRTWADSLERHKQNNKIKARLASLRIRILCRWGSVNTITRNLTKYMPGLLDVLEVGWDKGKMHQQRIVWYLSLKSALTTKITEIIFVHKGRTV